jgi:hypothetical protein
VKTVGRIVERSKSLSNYPLRWKDSLIPVASGGDHMFHVKQTLYLSCVDLQLSCHVVVRCKTPAQRPPVSPLEGSALLRATWLRRAMSMGRGCFT